MTPPASTYPLTTTTPHPGAAMATESEQIINVARDSVDPYLVTHPDTGNGTGIFITRDRDGDVSTLDLRDKLDLLPANPARKVGTVAFSDAASFVSYLRKHARDETEVYADDRRGTVRAVINAHGEGTAGYQDHVAELRLRQTPDWQEWNAHDGKMMGQAEFAEFIEDHLPNFAQPTGADMLELAQTFQATTKVDFASSQRVKSGETQLLYSESQNASAGKKGSLAIPDTFDLGLRVFERTDPFKVTARFRYRIRDGHLTLGYRLNRAVEVQAMAFEEVVEDLRNTTLTGTAGEDGYVPFPEVWMLP